MLHANILTPEQEDLIKLVREFGGDFYLVGGTALSLQLGHRRSIDFDLFTRRSFDNNRIIKLVEKYYRLDSTGVNQKDQLTVRLHGVQMTWYLYDYEIPLEAEWEGVIRMPDVLTIAAMKAYALGQRAKWKDYVDMYFLLKRFSLAEICGRTTELLGEGLFDEALLRGQLSYFEDVDYREEITWMPGWEVSEREVREYLSNVASTE